MKPVKTALLDAVRTVARSVVEACDLALGTGPFAEPGSAPDGDRSCGETWSSDEFCTHCQADTPHRCFTWGHERSSSGDTEECLRCGWIRRDWGEYEPPVPDLPDEDKP